MANLQQYANALVSVNGTLLSEAATITIKRTTAVQLAKSLAKGFCGVTKGAAMVNIHVESNVPSIGLELDPAQWMTGFGGVFDGQTVELAITVGNVSGEGGSTQGSPSVAMTLDCMVFITDDNSTFAVDQNSKLDFDCVTGPVTWTPAITSVVSQ